MTALATATPTPSAQPGWLSRAEMWLDARGKGAWIAAMVLGFVFFWPVGLALVIYMSFSNKWSCGGRKSHSMRTAHFAMSPSGNSAFDAYKADTLKRLQDEQENFEAFLERLRAAKDKAEFDQFMDERAKDAKARRTEAAAEQTEDA
ncbi:MAG: DUF2852 domain-containing protein [Marinovum sp.]|nr:DUF2852 domain-containing protein [Marinovum sp.]